MNERTEPRSRLFAMRADTLLAVAVVLLVVCGGSAVWFGIGWADDAGEDASGYSQTRDEVRRVGVSAIENFTTLDYTNPDAWVRGVSESTTGTLKSDLSNRSDQYKRVMTESRAKLTGKVLSSALTSLDVRKGSAEMIAAVDTTASSADQPKPAAQRLWLELTLERVGEGWKVANLLGAPGITTPGR